MSNLFDISKDDEMWTEACNTTDLIHLLRDPYDWIRKMNRKGKSESKFGGKPYKRKVLASYFMISISVAPKTDDSKRKKECKVAEDQYMVEGINGTSVITVRPKQDISGMTDEVGWDQYWNQWATNDEDHPLLVQRREDMGLGYGHLELSLECDDPETRTNKIAAFLMYAGDHRRCWHDPQADADTPYINRIHRKPAQMTGPDGRLENTGQRQFGDITPEQVKGINFIYTGRKLDVDSRRQRNREKLLVGENDSACDNQIGPIDPSAGGMITTSDVIIKWYPPGSLSSGRSKKYKSKRA